MRAQCAAARGPSRASSSACKVALPCAMGEAGLGVAVSWARNASLTRASVASATKVQAVRQVAAQSVPGLLPPPSSGSAAAASECHGCYDARKDASPGGAISSVTSVRLAGLTRARIGGRK